MRKGVFILFAAVFLIGVVSAATCDDNQTIMRLYQASNSHVAMWNESVTSYTEEICYNTIFGVNYTGADPHNCTSSPSPPNRVLSLYGVTNAHASNVTTTDYNQKVCYGDLTCVYDKSTGTSCSNGGRIVARMYSGTNSHVSTAADTNYQVKICCKIPDSGAYSWMDMMGTPIDSAQVGDSVKLFAGLTSSGTFNIKKDLLVDSDVGDIVGGVVGGNLIGTWTIPDDLSDGDTLYFKVNGGSTVSNDLVVGEDEDDSPMDITILSPSCGDYFNKSEGVQVEIDADDEDDVIIGTVRIGGVVVSNLTNGGVSFAHTFSSVGNYQIVAEAVNSRGKRMRHIANIMIIDLAVNGKYVAACISEPKDFSSINSSVVDFIASTTRGLEVASGVVSVIKPEDGTNRFSWYWNFQPDDRSWTFVRESSPLAYEFSTRFATAGDNSASLRVTFE